MVFRYFADTDMLYIELAPGVSTESQEVAPGVVIDFDANERIIGIEVEDASASTDLSKLHVLALPVSSLVFSDRTFVPAPMPDEKQVMPMLAEPRATYAVAGLASPDSGMERIVSDPAVMVGRPAIRGTRLTVEHILNLLASGVTPAEIVAEYDGLSEQDIRACLRFAAKSLRATE